MLSELWDDLPSTSIRAIAKSLFKGFYELGITANEALQQLRDNGLGYRRQDFLSDFREGLGSFEQYTRIRYVNLDKTPTEGILESKYFGVPDKYSFTFRVTGTDNLTGDISERYFMYHRNSLATRGEMEDVAISWYSNISDSSPNFTVLSGSIVEGYINPLWS